MKKAILILMLAFISWSVKGQTVTIPDAHFVTYLQTNFPTCMTGNLMDTTCAAIMNDTLVNCYNLSIADLTGIQYFHHLTRLLCNSNLLTSLPPLPNTLTDLQCGDTLLTSLPVLPSSLTYFGLETTLFTSIPVALPPGLLTLDCSWNQLTTLPSLPLGLQTLSCAYNLLDSLPVLPLTLVTLECQHNPIVSLPTLPANLTDLECNNCQLVSLPELDNTSLGGISCEVNYLTTLPALPSTLWNLTAYQNPFTCVPVFPSSITSFWLWDNPIPVTCLQNYIPAMDSITLSLPLCVSGNLATNPNNCPSSSGIAGYSYEDNNSNCIYDTLDFPEQNLHIMLYDSINNLIVQTYSAINGVYDFPVTTGRYTVKIDTAGMPYTINCTHPGIDSMVTLTTANPLATNVNFSIACKAGFDVGVQSVVPIGNIFPGQEHHLGIVAGDMTNWYNLHCASGISGQVVVTVTGPVTYDSIVYGSLMPTIAGNVYTYTIADYGAINSSTAFGLIFTTDSTAITGDSICVNASVTPIVGDSNVSNNTYSFCYYVGNSYDPNYKETYPVYVPDDFTDYFTYTIHFQNTGSAAAVNIHLQDTLDANLDLKTFQVINYSNYNTTWLTGNKLSINFPNINLPDSTSNFNGSQGFFQYRIKPLAVNHTSGTQIHNKASIYFDYNAPIVTNTTLNEFYYPLGINKYSMDSGQLSVYPNPTNGAFKLELKGVEIRNLKVEVSNVLGEIVYESLINNKQSTIDLSNQASGIYFVRVIGGTQALNKRIVKE